MSTDTKTKPPTPAVWVGCLACYNAGDLVGEWVPAATADEFTPCHRPTHEEWWCFDLEHTAPLIDKECSPYEAARTFRQVEEVAAYLHDDNAAELVAFWVDTFQGTPSTWLDDDPQEVAEQIEQQYRGQWDTFRAFAMEYADGANAFGCPTCGSHVTDYVDWDAYARDLRGSFTVEEVRPADGPWFVRVWEDEA